MGEITGGAGSVTFATGYVANCRSWTLTFHGDTYDITDFAAAAAGYKEFLPGLKEWSGSYTCMLDDTIVLVAPAGAAASATFSLDGTRTLSGNIIVEDVSPDVPSDGLAMVTISFRGSGALSIN